MRDDDVYDDEDTQDISLLLEEEERTAAADVPVAPAPTQDESIPSATGMIPGGPKKYRLPSGTVRLDN